MTILDRSIARHFLFNVLMLFVILSCFVVTIDVSVNARRYVSLAHELAEEAGKDPTALRTTLVTVFLVADLWWPRLIQLLTFLLGLVMAGAMGFTCTQMARHRELVAILASGMPLQRVARPVLLAAFALCTVQLAIQELVLPRIAPLLQRDHGDAGRRTLQETYVPLTSDGAGNVFMATRFEASRETLTSLVVWMRSGTGIASERITADLAVWREGGWDLENGQAEARSLMADENRAPSIRRVDRIETDLSPTAIKIRRYAGYSQCLSWRQLTELERAIDEGDGNGADTSKQLDRLARLKWGRLSSILTNLLALSITLPFFLTREPRNMVIQSLKCAPVAILSLVGGILGAAATIPGIPPEMSVFVPALILLPISIATVSSVKT